MNSRYYNKDELKQKLEVEQIYDLLEQFDAEPEYTENGLIARTICHNREGGSRKLYYYDNTKLFKCYSGCPEGSFDVFELCIKVQKLRKNLDWELYDAMDYIASYFGFEGTQQEEEDYSLADWHYFAKHHIDLSLYARKSAPQLKEYNPIILTRFAYPRIAQWEQEGISTSICRKNLIGYYPGSEQITIPHFDIDGRLIGIRGRTLADEEAECHGKYRPLLIGKQSYNHPLSMNLYNLNNSKENVRKARTAVIFEGEKSCLAYQSYYGEENDISVACCGSSISSYHIDLLKNLGVQEVIVAFDRDFMEIGDEEFKRLKAKLIHLNNKYGTRLRLTAIFDKKMILPHKASPIDAGPQVFEKLLKERIVPHE
jgi:hypothetical protein